MAWTIPVPMLPDESISSWLVRAAMAQGCDPLTLTGSLWGGWRAWSVDVDRGLSSPRLEVLSNVSGVGTGRIAEAALRPPAERIAGRELQSAGTWPWMLALGLRNRKRHGGQQCCPACLSEGQHPYLRRHWRFAWHVACERHGVRLVDECPGCGAALAPHCLLASDRHLAACHRCRADLRATARVPADARAAAFQSAADSALVAGSVWTGARTGGVDEWFAVAGAWTAMVRLAVRRVGAALAAVGVDVHPTASPVGLPLELLSVRDREVLFCSVWHLLKLNATRLEAAFVEQVAPAASMRGLGRRVPALLRGMAARLPDGARQRKQWVPPQMRPRSERAVRGAWLRIQRKMKAGLR